MSEPAVIFRDLPATFPEKDRYQKPSIVSSLIFHVVLILVLIVVPLLLPQSISQRELLITLVAPVGPPPAPLPLPVPVAVAAPPPAIASPVDDIGADQRHVTPGALCIKSSQTLMTVGQFFQSNVH